MYQKILEYTKVNFKLRKVIIPITAVFSSLVCFAQGFSPFGVAMLCSLFLKGYSMWYSLIFILSYGLSNSRADLIPQIICCGVVCLFILKSSFLKRELIFKAFVCLALFLCKVIYAQIEGINIYVILEALFEALICFALINEYKTFIEYFSGKCLRRTVKQKELNAIVLIALICLSAFSQINLFFDVSSVLYLTIILICGYKFSLSTTALCGILLGAVCGINDIENIYSVISFALSGVCGSAGKRYGKTGTILCFILSNAAFTYYVNNSEEVLINLVSIIIAGGVLYLIPEKALSEFKDNILLLVSNKGKEEERMNIIKSFTNIRLKKLTEAFESISSVLQDGKKRKTGELNSAVDSMVASVSERVCKRCKGCKRCWVNNYNETFDIIKNLFYISSKRGWAENYDIPVSFREICYNHSKLVVEANKVYELFRVNEIWENKANESKMLISQQFGSMSRVTECLAEELSGKYSFRLDMEKEIISALDIEGIKVISVTVIRENIRHITIKMSVKWDIKKNENLLLSVIERVSGKRIKIQSSNIKGGVSFYDLAEKEIFKIDTGISRIRPDKESMCGDSYSIMKPDNEKVIIALSDGMGTGEMASKESKDTVNLLEKLLSAGIEKNIAIKLINSVLILKSYNECFATIDMLVFDVYSGEGEFIKTGGVSSYILRKNEVTEICSCTLPTGIISDAKSSSYKTNLEDGDVVVILSDGVTDVSVDDSWLREALIKSGNLSSKEIADSIMENACKKIENCIDDMTVIVSRINLN